MSHCSQNRGGPRGNGTRSITPEMVLRLSITTQHIRAGFSSCPTEQFKHLQGLRDPPVPSHGWRFLEVKQKNLGKFSADFPDMSRGSIHCPKLEKKLRASSPTTSRNNVSTRARCSPTTHRKSACPSPASSSRSLVRKQGTCGGSGGVQQTVHWEYPDCWPSPGSSIISLWSLLSKKCVELSGRRTFRIWYLQPKCIFHILPCPEGTARIFLPFLCIKESFCKWVVFNFESCDLKNKRLQLPVYCPLARDVNLAPRHQQPSVPPLNI